jgi:hypothetical protein
MTLSGADPRAVEEAGAGEVPRADRPRRRVFSPEYKLAIGEGIRPVDRAGRNGALLRREGLTGARLDLFGPPLAMTEHDHAVVCLVFDLVRSA